MWSDLKSSQRATIIVFGCAWSAAVVFVIANGLF